MFVVMMQVAWAAPRLDYVAVELCPDAGRFSDEVSARIGAQAFGTDPEAMVIRLAASGGEVLGTLELGAGVRMVRGASCDEVFDGLVVAAATLLGSPPSNPVAQPAPDLKLVQVTVETTLPGVTVTRVTGGATAMGGLSAVHYEDLCIAPCTFEIPPGVYEIGTHGNHRSTCARPRSACAPHRSRTSGSWDR